MIALEPPISLPGDGTTATLRLLCEARTADDAPLFPSLELSAHGPRVAAIQAEGPEADPASRSLFYLMFGQQTEAGMLEAISAAAWGLASVCGLDVGACRFHCVFRQPLPRGTLEEQAIRGQDHNIIVDNNEIRFEGLGEELRTLVMVLASLEFGEVPWNSNSSNGKEWSPWTPADGRIQMRRRGVRGGGGGRGGRLDTRNSTVSRYEIRVFEKHGAGGDETVAVYELNTRQARALIDILDVFGQLNSAFGIGEPREIVGPVPVWRRFLGLGMK